MPGTTLPARKPAPQIIQPQSQQQPEQVDPQRRPVQQSQPPSLHSRSRTASSSIFPTSEVQMQPSGMPPQIHPAQYQAPLSQPAAMARRTPSNATASTMSSGNPNIPMRQNSGSSLQRSTSSRSGGSPTSYVALMRKQKATVWSDRAQVRYICKPHPPFKHHTKTHPPTARRPTSNQTTTIRPCSRRRGDQQRQQCPRLDLRLRFLHNRWRPLQDPPPRRPQSPRVYPKRPPHKRRAHATQSE